MLQVTSRAATTLADARAQIGAPDHFGVRVFASVTPEAKSAFQFDFVEGPVEGDQVGETEGTRFFVAPEVAEPLENAVLDAEETGRLVLTRSR